MYISKPSFEGILPKSTVVRAQAEEMEAIAQQALDQEFENSVREGLCHLPKEGSQWAFSSDGISGQFIVKVMARLKELGYQFNTGTEQQFYVSLPDTVAEHIENERWTPASFHQRSISLIAQKRFSELTADIRAHLSSTPRETFQAECKPWLPADKACRLWLQELASLQAYAYREILPERLGVDRGIEINIALASDENYFPPVILSEEETAMVDPSRRLRFECLLSQVPWRFNRGETETTIHFPKAQSWELKTILQAEELLRSRGYQVTLDRTVDAKALLISAWNPATTAPSDPIEPSDPINSPA